MQSIPIADLGGTLSLLGLGAVVAAVVTHFLNVLRDRASARRAWLGEALSNSMVPSARNSKPASDGRNSFGRNTPRSE